MTPGEQLSAMEVMAVDPIRRVLVPRLWGGIIAMPILAAVFSMVGILGGWVVGRRRCLERRGQRGHQEPGVRRHGDAGGAL
ncbi:hypothetical protein G6F62_015537 [Rhizopus arrhizus]|nr:hypothetical protein G6F62_015537 [Rhizopus arrhizus]